MGEPDFVGRSAPKVVGARSVEPFLIKLDGEQHATPWGDDPIEIHVVGPDGITVLAQWDGRY